MKASILEKLEKVSERYQELAALLSDVEIINDQDLFRKYSKEYAEIEPVVLTYQGYQSVLTDLAGAHELLNEQDPHLRELAIEEVKVAKDRKETMETQLQYLMLPKDPNDDRNIFLEVRAGTGGDEAAIFSGDLFRMYVKYAESQGWKVEMTSSSPGEQGGFKEVIARIAGQDVYSKLKFESGAHRVQRVPGTESQGRIHTSACTVAILPDVESIDEIDINRNDLRIDTYRSSGAGGQHVNTTDSAIRITHLPTGVVVECQDERSQHKNKARAMSLLQAKLLAHAQQAQQQAQSDQRRDLVGSGDRSERMRTYNYPQGRVTDHRINLTLYRLPEILEGQLSLVIDVLIQEYQADQLAALDAE